MTFVALAIGAISFTTSLVRWARVAQREHYLPGGCTASAARWVRARWENLVLLVLSVGALVSALVPGTGTPEAPVATLLATCTVCFPFWLRLRGVGRPLKWTRRLIVLAVVSIVIDAIAVVAAWAGELLHPTSIPAVAAAVLPLAFELGMRVTAPYERRIARGFQQRLSYQRPRRPGHVGPHPGGPGHRPERRPAARGCPPAPRVAALADPGARASGDRAPCHPVLRRLAAHVQRGQLRARAAAGGRRGLSGP